MASAYGQPAYHTNSQLKLNQKLQKPKNAKPVFKDKTATQKIPSTKYSFNAASKQGSFLNPREIEEVQKAQ